MLVPALVLLLAATPLDDAKAHLAAGKLDEVLFDLDGKSISEADRPTAAAVLAEAARAALQAKDLVLSLQFAQMALRFDGKEALALETGARASLAQKQFDPAEEYADRWMKAAPKSGRARLLRAEIALEEGEWTKVLALTRELDMKTVSDAERTRLLEVVRAATQEIGERNAARTQAQAFERQLEAQILQARETIRSTPPTVTDAKPVILYSASWCGYCREAKAWFRDHRIAFVEKDIEADTDAAAELAEKKRARGRGRQGGVPWIDTGTELISGFDVPLLERAFLGKR